MAFIVSKILSAIRLDIFFRNINIHLLFIQNIKLYWLGMFYNLFLPGSISGDAYKVILLSKRFGAAYKKTTSAVLLDRLSGLLGLGLLLSAYGLVVLKNDFYAIALIAGAVLAVVMFYYALRQWFRDFLPGFAPTLLWGIAVQACQIVCLYLIMAALGIPAHITEYVFLFLISSVVAVLPLTIGGLGIREIVFLEGARYFALEQETPVIISLLFYLITMVSSVAGGWFVFKDPLIKKEKDSVMSP
jgi:glycosyltransferase 2 family protein